MRRFEGYTKGVNLGGWISQCGHNYTKEHYETFITEKDIEIIRSWGADHVRLPIDYNVIQFDDGKINEEGFVYIERCLEWCKKNGLKVVLDLHKTLGFVFDDADSKGFFYDERLQDCFVDLWIYIAKRYGKCHDFVAFELLNEVTFAEVAEIWNGIADRTIKAIRELNKDVRIIIGGIYNSSIYGLQLMAPPQDENIVFTFHCYSPMIFTHQGAGWIATMPKEKENYEVHYPGKVKEYLEISGKTFGHDYDDEFVGLEEENMNEKFFLRLFERAKAVSDKYHVPLYCGEYGVIDLADGKDTVAWYKDIHKALDIMDIPRSAWSYKKMNFGLSSEHYEDIIDEIKNYL